MSPPYLSARNLDMPQGAREPLLLLTTAIAMCAANNAVMDVAFIRHRWRVVVFVARIEALFLIVCAMSWPAPIFFAGIMFSVINGLVDPRLHVASVRRNPSGVFRVISSAGAICHHTATVRLFASTMQPLALAGGSFMDIPVPLVVAMWMEILAWLIDTAVITRNAPHWFWYMSAGGHGVQILALVVMLLWVENSTTNGWCIYTVIVGNTLLLTAFVTGHGSSTFECKNSKEENAGRLNRRESVARKIHRAHPMGSDTSEFYAQVVRRDVAIVVGSTVGGSTVVYSEEDVKIPDIVVPGSFSRPGAAAHQHVLRAGII